MSVDCAVVGASFAGLACASALARAGMRVTVLEKKADPGEKLHTTGIIVKEAIDQVALLDGLPAELVRRIDGVRLYAPNLRYVDLAAPGYYFLATDTPRVMRWLAARAEQAGAHIAYRKLFARAERIQSGFDLGELGTARFSTTFKATRCSTCCSAPSRCAWQPASSISITKAYSIPWVAPPSFAPADRQRKRPALVEAPSSCG